MSQTAFLGKGRYSFHAKKYGENSISELNSKILEYLESTYGEYGFVYPSRGGKVPYDVKIADGIIFKNEFISKMVNNYTVFKAYIIENGIKDWDTFYESIVSDFSDVYNWAGDFFKRKTMPIIARTIKIGEKGENKAIEAFEKYAIRRGYNILMLEPNIEEDITGIDAKFIYKDQTYTIQVKPFTHYRESEGSIYIRSQGSLSLNTNYLVLYNEDRFIICRNHKNKKIVISGDYFIVCQEEVTIL